MAQPHTPSGQLIRLEPLGERLAASTTTALFKAAQLEAVRVVLPRGQALRQHHVPGEITLQCIEGVVDLTAGGAPQRMHAGDFVHLAAQQPHALVAVEDASLLLTICLVAGPTR
ncbi:cupin domain-containing protein [Paenacidovorax monticola]|uniref:Cupin domain-containing protein n=1 Tax=Paenacidovorax monticola TaxID=1926868 RepID=A0A7H0HJZ2_9BURK|nr:cupin domain-containing protein [Paenacidovorax monticola]QNP60858.1 cupin domain-containing protein [Paenacidovorax monticola]